MLLIASQSCPGLETDWQHTSSSLSDADTTNSLASHSFAFRRVIHFIIWTCCWHIWDLIWEEGHCCVQGVRTWLRSSMIVKTEEDPLKEADIMVENFVDHVIMEVWDNKEHFVPLLFKIQSVFKAFLVHILTNWPSGSFSTGLPVLAKSELISPKTRDAPWKQVIDCQFSEQTPAPPFSPSCCT